MKFCLDASPKRKVTSKGFKRGTFSPCRWDSNQIWELNSNGTLVNSYSGLCATVNYIEDAAVNSGGIHSWIATGRKGLSLLSNKHSRWTLTIFFISATAKHQKWK